MSKLKGKVAVITGGNSGIGYATAELFLQEGATVIITGRRKEAVDEAVQQLGKGAHGVVSDAGNMSDLAALQKKNNQHQFFRRYPVRECRRRTFCSF